MHNDMRTRFFDVHRFYDDVEYLLILWKEQEGFDIQQIIINMFAYIGHTRCLISLYEWLFLQSYTNVATWWSWWNYISFFNEFQKIKKRNYVFNWNAYVYVWRSSTPLFSMPVLCSSIFKNITDQGMMIIFKLCMGILY